MTTWNETTNPGTAWQNTLNTTQVIEFIDNEFNINYSLVDINGRSRILWNDTTVQGTAWRDA